MNVLFLPVVAGCVVTLISCGGGWGTAAHVTLGLPVFAKVYKYRHRTLLPVIPTLKRQLAGNQCRYHTAMKERGKLS